MASSTRSWLAVGLVGLAGCSLDTTGAGPAGAPPSPAGTSTDTGDVSSSGDSPLPPADSSSSSGGEPEPDPDPDPAMLTISDGPTFDFGPVMAGSSGEHSFTVTNVGGIEATALQGLPPAAPFDYAGGAFPGQGGDCGASLPAGDACTVVLAFAPAQWGPFQGELVLTHDGGTEVGRPVVGDGQGISDNLLVNPGGEDGGDDPPDGWTDDFPGRWLTGAWVTPFEGALFIGSDSGPDNDDFWLVQDVPLDAFADRLDQGLPLRAAFEGRARNWDTDNDVYRIQLRFFDPMGNRIGEWDTGEQTAADWTLVSTSEAIPTDATRMRIRLGCRKGSGMYCDAYYDAMSLRVAYP
ncbi:MAG: hypothetical protein H6712_03170 [Myxococcales bacterium]|nr:hypothetical protein [Myxococcales bacterium]MCB9712827.1 hypothetical protein [Myxococcales bacterium]